MNAELESTGEQLGGNMAKVKSGAVLLGIMYAIVLILLFPYLYSKGLGVDSILLFGLASILSVVIVHIFVNGLYYLTIIVPLIMAGFFFITGFIIWLHAPLIMGIIEAVFSYFDVNLNGIMDYYTRVGQTFMSIGGALWWCVKKAKDFNYAALYIYIIIIGLLGLFSGIVDMSLTVLFLIFWATISYKIHENPVIDCNDQLELVFKIIATLSIFIASFKKTITLSTLSSLDSFLYGYNSNINTGLIIYSMIIFLAVSFGIWKPSVYTKHVPDRVVDAVKNKLEVLKGFIFIRV